jgi:uncharacterized protein
MSRGNMEELLSSVAHNIEWVVPETLPWGGARHGADGIRAVVEILQQHADASWDTDEFLDVDDRVVVLGRMRGRAIATGQGFEVPFAHVWGMSQGVPASFHSYLDTAPITKALHGEA